MILCAFTLLSFACGAFFAPQAENYFESGGCD
jgi:hypothetical protein